MYGKDIETLLGALNDITVSTRNGIMAFTDTTSIMFTTKSDGDHSHSGGSHYSDGTGDHSHSGGAHYHEEDENPAAPPVINSAAFTAELAKVRKIESKLYTTRNHLNNSIGSPYSELYEVELRLSQCSVNQPAFLGPKVALVARLQTLASAVIDAKYAVIQYHDGLQRGYDNLFNAGKASVTWDDFVDGPSTGNVKMPT